MYKKLPDDQYAFYVSFTIFVYVTLFALSYSPLLELSDQVDFITESAYFILLLYIRLVVHKGLNKEKLILNGLSLMLAAAFYDIATESKPVKAAIDQIQYLDNAIEEGLWVASIAMIAIGVTNLLRRTELESVRDALTGLFNRKYLEKVTDNYFDLIYIDLDGLKRVNDEQGHEEGDLFISRFSSILLSTIDEDELAFRVGGDEFILLVKPSRRLLVLDNIFLLSQMKSIEFSFGVSTVEEGTLKDRIRIADRRMYEMKLGVEGNGV
ncbi:MULTISPECIES: GGDEF domain-containing protein [Vibrio]|uniref:GGDEF domain-containing protein n=1 Tax=Vibrio TaxID=662 RepID=UPI00142EE572|nr:MULTISPECIES: GGDEF domain-containing protein [Vibrio]